MTDFAERFAQARSRARLARLDIEARQARGEEVSPSEYSMAGILASQAIALEIEASRR